MVNEKRYFESLTIIHQPNDEKYNVIQKLYSIMAQLALALVVEGNIISNSILCCLYSASKIQSCRVHIPQFWQHFFDIPSVRSRWIYSFTYRKRKRMNIM